MEDVELSFRLAQHGTHITYVPEARVRHPQPERLSAHLARKFRYAQYASQLYRRYPSRILSDSSTPQSRRWQLLLLTAAAVLLIPGVLVSGLLGWVSLGLLSGSMGFSVPFIGRMFKKSWRLGMLVPLFVLTGDLPPRTSPPSKLDSEPFEVPCTG